MFKTVKLGKLFGVDVFAHWTLWPVLLYVAFATLLGGGPVALLGAAVFILGLTAFVYLHELGHALAGFHHGIRTRDIILLPVGGVARFDRAVLPPRAEYQIALAGPAVNLFIALMFMIPFWLSGGSIASLFSLNPAEGIIGQAVQVNLALALGNMIPALPLDGGRVVRGLLGMRGDHLEATRKTVKLSRYIGIAMVLASPFVSWLFALLGIYIVVAGLQELFVARAKSVFEAAQQRHGNAAWSSASDGDGGQATGSENDSFQFDFDRDRSRTVDATDVRHL